MKEVHDLLLINSLDSHDRLTSLLAFLNEHLLYCGSCIRLCDLAETLQEVVQELNKVDGVLLWGLVSEHEQKFDASGLHHGEVVDVFLLKLWQHELLYVIEQLVLGYHDLDRTILVVVGGDACCDEQVQKGGFLSPVVFSILLILSQKVVHIRDDQACDFFRELFGELLDELHAVSPPGLYI